MYYSPQELEEELKGKPQLSEIEEKLLTLMMKYREKIDESQSVSPAMQYQILGEAHDIYTEAAALAKQLNIEIK
jgi:hypothetical protein